MLHQIDQKRADTSKIVYQANTGEHQTSFKVTTFYINDTPIEIVTKDRDNLPIFCKRKPNSPPTSINNYFIVRKIYRFNTCDFINQTSNAIYNSRQHFKMESSVVTELRNILLKAFDNDKNISCVEITVDHEIDIRPYDRFKTFYISNLDLLISDSQHWLDHPHPYSDEGLNRKDILHVVEQRKVSGVFMELIDNGSNVKNRFTYMGKSVIEIPVKQDKSRESGVYYTRAECNHLDEIHIDPVYCTLDEAEEKLGLYKTKEEAESGGNPELLSKADEEKYRIEAVTTKRQLERERSEHEQSLLKAKRSISDMEYELEQTKKETLKLKEEIESRKLVREDVSDGRKHKREKKKHKRDNHYDDINLRRKDYYERRSYERKDTSELIKYIPAVLAGAAVAFGYMHSKNQ